MVRLKDERLLLHIGDPVVLELYCIQKSPHTLNLNERLIDLRCYGIFRVKCHFYLSLFQI
ncbi:MAG: hypothetical protein A3D87_02280 [Omnitrophica WOR_2 bacterium RIFCSPHIGHO2_02_FULL_50_17]|nr:MAG: hypothetical protein A3D87_02280 [Omnitrophica WOR_2 bacterium RIFCSPHIGHO2_02_FULL_50_17]